MLECRKEAAMNAKKFLLGIQKDRLISTAGRDLAADVNEQIIDTGIELNRDEMRTLNNLFSSFGEHLGSSLDRQFKLMTIISYVRSCTK